MFQQQSSNWHEESQLQNWVAPWGLVFIFTFNMVDSIANVYILFKNNYLVTNFADFMEIQ